jgi:hypothetical protein
VESGRRRIVFTAGRAINQVSVARAADVRRLDDLIGLKG